MSGAIVIIMQDPDSVSPPPHTDGKAGTEKPGKSITIPFDADDSEVELGHRVAQTLMRLRRRKA